MIPVPDLIPVIDMQQAFAGDPAATRRAADAIAQACTTSGFFYISGHGVPQPIIDRTLAEARDFFHLPLEQKRRVAINARHRGWNALGDALMYEAKRPDYKEFYSIGLELPDSDPDVVAGERLRGPNNWPADRPAFRAALAAYYDAMRACGERLLSCVAISLGAPADFFAPSYTKPLQRTQWDPLESTCRHASLSIL